MGRAIYTVSTSAVVASAAAGTGKTVLALVAPSSFGIDLLGFSVSFDGTDPDQAPVLWEVCRISSAGTTTSETPSEETTTGIAHGVTSGRNASSEPTVVNVVKRNSLSPNGGVYEYDWPLDTSPHSAVSAGFGIRITVPTGGAAVNTRAEFRFARC